MADKNTRGHASSSMSVRCAFCSKHTSTYINFGTSLSINVWVCTQHENELRANNVDVVSKFMYDQIHIIKYITNQFIKEY